MNRSSASSRRFIAALLAGAIAAVGLASQIHIHGQLADPSVRIAAKSGPPGPLSTHGCLACKLSHRSISSPPDVGTTCEPPVRTGRTIGGLPEIARSETYAPASPRAPPSTLQS